MRKSILVVCAVGAAAACSPPPHEPMRTLELSVARDDGVPLGAVALQLGDDAPVRTRDDGQGRWFVPVARGRLRVRVDCPSGHRATEPRTIDLRNGPPDVPMRLSFVCRPVVRSVALVVYAPGAEGQPVLVDGERIGDVGADATFHGVAARAPASTLRVAVEPGALLLDESSRDVELADRDELVLLTPTLRSPPPPVSQPRRRRSVPKPAPHVPYAIGRGRG